MGVYMHVWPWMQNYCNFMSISLHVALIAYAYACGRGSCTRSTCILYVCNSCSVILSVYSQDKHNHMEHVNILSDALVWLHGNTMSIIYIYSL